MKTRLDEMNEQAIAFHHENPQVAKLFVKFTMEMIERGFKHYSVTGIFERIRWETDVADDHGRSTFKVNNNYKAWYGRRFMEVYPQYDGFFRTRERISEHKPATHLPELGPQDYEARW